MKITDRPKVIHRGRICRLDSTWTDPSGVEMAMLRILSDYDGRTWIDYTVRVAELRDEF